MCLSVGTISNLLSPTLVDSTIYKDTSVTSVNSDLPNDPHTHSFVHHTASQKFSLTLSSIICVCVVVCVCVTIWFHACVICIFCEFIDFVFCFRLPLLTLPLSTFTDCLFHIFFAVYLSIRLEIAHLNTLTYNNFSSSFVILIIFFL